jgi:heterodisulfide reductase subunit C
MDMPPRQVMRAIQLGLKHEVLSSSAIWLCVSCQTCSARCPLEIDIAKVMESLRLLAVKENIKPPEKGIGLFHHIFLGLIEHRGRVHELELGLRYNLSSRHPFANSSLGVKMIAKGKMTSIRPPRVKGASEVEELFRKVRDLEAEVSSPESGEEHE